ncbi:MAG TPA: SulP family inorganic anion transporter [Deinococcales bacterium]|nr:SulP family inorganic anion transporter [Deinococcales bacterium]
MLGNATLKGLLNGVNPAGAWAAEFKGYNASKLQQDVLAGITVGFVALPLALAFGVTSGAGAAAGLFTAIVAGLVAAAFGGSRYQISGPTGAMTVVLLPVIARYGLEKVFVVGIIAGIMLVVLGLLRVGRFVQLIPWPVVTGFTNGIAVIIFLQQVPALLGVPAPKGADGILPATWEAIRAYARAPQWPTLALTAATVLVMLAWTRVSKRIPGSIVALLAVTALSLLLQVPRIGQIPTALPTIRVPTLDWQDLSVLFGPAMAIALLAGIESLLSAVVADGMTIKERHDPDRELIGQGLANIASPLFGGIPATGAIARTAVNIRAGGQTRLVGIVHAAFLVLIVIALGRYASVIPRAALAGILMVTAGRMVELDAVRAVLRSTKSDLTTMLLTTAVTIGFDLVLAIEVGLAVAGLLFIQRRTKQLAFQPIDLTEKVPQDLDLDRDLLQERVVAYRVDGPLFFGVAGEFLETLLSVSNVDVLILRMRRANVLDASGAHALETIHQTLERRNVRLILSGLQPQPKALLTKMGLLDKITSGEHHLFDTTDQAIAHAWSHVQRRRAGRARATEGSAGHAEIAQTSRDERPQVQQGG